NSGELVVRGGRKRFPVWRLEMADDGRLQPGFSGGPVMDKNTGKVVAVARYRENEGDRGYGTAISALRHVWPNAPHGVLPPNPGKPARRRPSPVIDLQNVSTSRMPVTGPHLFGRDDKLKQLDRLWSERKAHIVTLTAWGGVGKTALMNAWLRLMKKRKYK